jgi:hypothetical protein
MKTFIKSTVIAASILAPFASMSSASAIKLPKVYIATCAKTLIQIPTTIALSCKNRGLYLERLVWQTWTLSSATATGQLYNNGKTTSATFTFSGTSSYKGKSYFTHVSGGSLAARALIKP